MHHPLACNLTESCNMDTDWRSDSAADWASATNAKAPAPPPAPAVLPPSAAAAAPPISAMPAALLPLLPEGKAASAHIADTIAQLQQMLQQQQRLDAAAGSSREEHGPRVTSRSHSVTDAAARIDAQL